MTKQSKLVVTIFIILFFNSCELETTNEVEKFLLEQGVKKGLIINADDLGMGLFANNGIMSLWDKGAITSISLQTVDFIKSFDGDPVIDNPFEHAIENIHLRDSIDVGCHLTLHSSDGYYARPVLPPSEVPSLVDKNGFLKRGYFHFLFASKDEIKAECIAQIEKALSNHIELSHIDSHQGWGHIIPGFKKLYAEIAAEYALPARWPIYLNDDKLLNKYNVIIPNHRPKHFIFLSDFNIKKVTDKVIEKRKNFFLKKLNNLPPGISEVVCHPSMEKMKGNEWRVVDYMVLTDDEIKEKIDSMVKSKEIVMLSYGDLKKLSGKL